MEFGAAFEGAHGLIHTVVLLWPIHLLKVCIQMLYERMNLVDGVMSVLWKWHKLGFVIDMEE